MLHGLDEIFGEMVHPIRWYNMFRLFISNASNNWRTTWLFLFLGRCGREKKTSCLLITNSIHSLKREIQKAKRNILHILSFYLSVNIEHWGETFCNKEKGWVIKLNKQFQNLSRNRKVLVCAGAQWSQLSALTHTNKQVNSCWWWRCFILIIKIVFDFYETKYCSATNA